ncbi:MAG: sugar phosphate nucleotidyltransferase [Bdellovibrionota bacterium]|jgi:bifunctional UDP-N-acetylglucosamine pyrophosphorylase/glucosamine-1-phosphate N-acetyltransferase
MDDSLAIIILAAGLGKRMGSATPKVLSKVGDMTLIEHVLSCADSLHPQKTVVVIGHKGELVKEVVTQGVKLGRYSNNISFAVQQEMRGTGDAAKSALPFLQDFTGTVLILCGDIPLIRPQSLKALLKTHSDSKATVSLISMRVTAENAYGRIVRDKDGYVLKIVEFKDCNDTEKELTEANTGIYAVDSAFLAPALTGLTNDNAQGEYYLTDIVDRAAREGQTVAASLHEDPTEFLGVNTPADLDLIKQALERRQVSN